jgi:pre-rRNA-processing protein TSR3
MPAPKHRSKPSGKGGHHRQQRGHHRGDFGEEYEQESSLPSVNDLAAHNSSGAAGGSEEPAEAAAAGSGDEEGEGAQAPSSSSSSSVRLAMWDLGQCDKKRCTGECMRTCSHSVLCFMLVSLPDPHSPIHPPLLCPLDTGTRLVRQGCVKELRLGTPFPGVFLSPSGTRCVC